MDPIKKAIALRQTLAAEDKLLVVDFKDTLQGKDTSRVVELMPVVGKDVYPFRTKVNIKEIDPIAFQEYKVPFFDIRTKSDKEIEDFVKKHGFDFPLWFKKHPGFEMKNAGNYNLPFLFQVGGCNFHDGTEKGGCKYCFVDDKSNNGRIGEGKTRVTIEEVIDSFENAREKIREQYSSEGHEMNIKVIRMSGGEPTIVLDWMLNLWRAIEKKGLDAVGHLDTNLSTAGVFDRFENYRIFEKFTLDKLAEFPIKVLAAIKGIEQRNLSSNVQCNATMEEQEYSLKEFIKAGFDVYPEMYNPDPRFLKTFLEKMDNLIEHFSLRLSIDELKVYRPTRKRLGLLAKAEGFVSDIEKMAYMHHHLGIWNENFWKSRDILAKHLEKRYGVGYRETTRADVKLKIK